MTHSYFLGVGWWWWDFAVHFELPLWEYVIFCYLFFQEIDDDNVPITEQLSFEDLSDGEISELENFYSEQLPELGMTSNPSNRTGGASSKSYKSTSTDLGYDSFNERVPRKWEHNHSVVWFAKGISHVTASYVTTWCIISNHCLNH